MARRHVHDNVRDINRALAESWQSDATSQTSREVAEATGLSNSQVQSAGRQCYSQPHKEGRKVIDAFDFDGERVRIRIHYLRGTFMMEPEQGWPEYWASKPDGEEF